MSKNGHWGSRHTIHLVHFSQQLLNWNYVTQSSSNRRNLNTFNILNLCADNAKSNAQSTRSMLKLIPNPMIIDIFMTQFANQQIASNM